jgi:TolB-like protein
MVPAMVSYACAPASSATPLDTTMPVAPLSAVLVGRGPPAHLGHSHVSSAAAQDVTRMQTDPAPFRRFLRELRRRRVFRVAAVYAGVGFIVVQAGQLLIPALLLPQWTYSFLVLLALLGFPVAVGLAWAFDITPEGVQRTRPAGPEEGRRPAQRPVPRAAWFVAGALVVLGGGWYAVTRERSGSTAPSLDPGVVAVLPFRVLSSDPSLGYLSEGMVELLAVKFTGTGGPRAVDPQSALFAAERLGGPDALEREASLSLARSLGAGLVSIGSIVVTPAGLTINASMLESATGRQRAAASVEGPPDQLPALVDRLAAALLSLSAGEAEQRLPSLTQTPWPALMAYLEGRAAHRRGEFETAGRQYERAFELDSTFALAALNRALAIQWLNDPRWLDALEMAWNRRDRLSPRELLLIQAYGGPNFPAPSTMTELIHAAERATRELPERAEAWYWLGDRLFHQGDWIGWPDAHAEAVRHLERAIALDSTLPEPIIHMVEIGAVDGDTAAVRRFSHLYFRADQDSETARSLRWLSAHVLGDTATLRQLRAGIDTMSSAVLRNVLQASEAPGGPLEDAAAIAAELRGRHAPRAERLANLMRVVRHELARGRPSSAESALAEWERVAGQTRHPDRIVTALYWGGDAAAAERSLGTLERIAAEPGDDADGERANALCSLGQWHLWHGRTEQGGELTRRLRELLGGLDPERALIERLDVCTRVLEALVRVQQHDAGARSAVERLDGYFRAGPMEALYRIGDPDSGFSLESPIIMARLWEALGEPERALAAIRRRHNPYFEPSILEQHARLEAEAGERDVAILYYQHYLRLLADPEPALLPRVEAVRARLHALQPD